MTIFLFFSHSLCFQPRQWFFSLSILLFQPLTMFLLLSFRILISHLVGVFIFYCKSKKKIELTWGHKQGNKTICKLWPHNSNDPYKGAIKDNKKVQVTSVNKTSNSFLPPPPSSSSLTLSFPLSHYLQSENWDRNIYLVIVY